MAFFSDLAKTITNALPKNPALSAGNLAAAAATRAVPRVVSTPVQTSSVRQAVTPSNIPTNYSTYTPQDWQATDWNNVSDDDLLSMLFGTMPDYSQYGSEIGDIYSSLAGSIAPARGEILDIARSTAQQKANESQVVEMLTRELARKYGGYKNISDQTAAAVRKATEARPAAIAALANQYRTTEGDIAPGVLAAADVAIRPTMEAAQSMSDVRNALLGDVSTNIAQGLQAYRDTLTGNQAYAQALQSDIGTEMALRDALANAQLTQAQLAQQGYGNLSEVIGSQTSGSGDMTSTLANTLLAANNPFNGITDVSQIPSAEMAALKDLEDPYMIAAIKKAAEDRYKTLIGNVVDVVKGIDASSPQMKTLLNMVQMEVQGDTAAASKYDAAIKALEGKAVDTKIDANTYRVLKPYLQGLNQYYFKENSDGSATFRIDNVTAKSTDEMNTLNGFLNALRAVKAGAGIVDYNTFKASR